jgi:hypothetical protein
MGQHFSSWAMGSDKLKVTYNDFWTPILIILTAKSGLKKTDGSWFFDPHFDIFGHFLVL